MDLAAPCCPLAHPPQLKKTCIPPPPNHPHQKYPTSILYSPMPPFSSDLICLLLTIILTSLPPNPILHTCKKNCILHIAALHLQLQGSCCYYTLSLTHTLSSLHTHTHTHSGSTHYSTCCSQQLPIHSLSLLQECTTPSNNCILLLYISD